MGRRSRQPQAKPGLLDELKELRKFRESLPASANDVQATVGDDSGSEEQVTRAEERLQEILTTTLDEFAEAQKLERQRLKQEFLEKNVTHSAKSIKAEQHIQKLLDHLKKTTFWEFRVKYLAELGPAIDNAIRVEVLSVDPEVVAEAVRFVTVLAIDWNENVRETAVIQLANMTKADDAVAVDCLLKAIQDHTPMVRKRAVDSIVSMTEAGDENIISKVALILESYSKDIRDCALQVILEVASPDRAVDIVGALLAHQRTDLRLWAAQALGHVISPKSCKNTPTHDCIAPVTLNCPSDNEKPGQHCMEDEVSSQETLNVAVQMAKEDCKHMSPVSALIEQGANLLEQLPVDHTSMLLQDLSQSQSPLAQAVRARTPELLAPGSLSSNPQVLTCCAAREMRRKRDGESCRESGKSQERSEALEDGKGRQMHRQQRRRNGCLKEHFQREESYLLRNCSHTLSAFIHILVHTQGEMALSPKTEESVKQLILEGGNLIEELPDKHQQMLLSELQRSQSPIAHALRARTPEILCSGSQNRAERMEQKREEKQDTSAAEESINGNVSGGVSAEVQGHLVHGHGEMRNESRSRQTRVVEYLEPVLRKLAYSIHDPNWQVQRTALAIMRQAVEDGELDIVANSCKYVVPIIFRKTPQLIVDFIIDMHKGIHPESNVDATGKYYTSAQPNSDQTLVREVMQKTEADIASTLATFNALSPALGGPKQNKETFTIKKGTLDTSQIAQQAEALEATRNWIPDIPIQPKDMILVGPQRRLVQVSDTVALQGGLEIYGTDRHGNRVYIPANSSLPDHQFVHLAARERLGGTWEGQDANKGNGQTSLIAPRTLPVISTVAARQMPRGHKYNTVAAFTGGGVFVHPLNRSHRSFVAASESLYRSSRHSPRTSSTTKIREASCDSPTKRPEYGYAGNRSFTPEARFTGVLDFLTEAPHHLHASYNKSRLGQDFQNDLAANRSHYLDPLDNNQIPPDQSLLQTPANVPRAMSPGIGDASSHSTSFSGSRNLMGMGSRLGTAGSPMGSRLNTASGNRLNTAGSRIGMSSRLGTPSRLAATKGKNAVSDIQEDERQKHGIHLYAETFKLDDLTEELDKFVTYQVSRPDKTIGRPLSPKYSQAVKRGTNMLTAERTKNFLHTILDKQVQELRAQTHGVGLFEKVIPSYQGPTPEKLYEKIRIR